MCPRERGHNRRRCQSREWNHQGTKTQRRDGARGGVEVAKEGVIEKSQPTTPRPEISRNCRFCGHVAASAMRPGPIKIHLGRRRRTLGLPPWHHEIAISGSSCAIYCRHRLAATGPRLSGFPNGDRMWHAPCQVGFRLGRTRHAIICLFAVGYGTDRCGMWCENCSRR